MAADSEDSVILACTVLIQSQSVVGRQTDPTDASMKAKMCEALYAVSLPLALALTYRSVCQPAL